MPASTVAARARLAVRIALSLGVIAASAAADHVRFAYYPYADTIALQVDGLAATSAEVRVRDAGGTVIDAATVALSAAGHRGFRAIPPLADGAYHCLVVPTGFPAAASEFAFERRHHAFEHNRLGMADVVVAPFEPLRVDGDRIETVLRSHRLNGVGLWDQVEALGAPLLTGPMRLDVRIRGALVPATGTMTITERTATRVVCDCRWSAGALTGRSTCTWDVDGVMRWRATLEPTTAPIDSVTLVVPVVDAVAPLFHDSGMLIRGNDQGAIPTGSGAIWDSTRTHWAHVTGDYATYLWVGGDERGISVFGENDKGWVRDPAVPCQSLVRDGGTLELRLALVSRPGVLAGPTTIELGFQATPVKPLPVDWRRWNPDNWLLDAAVQADPGHALSMAFLGDEMCWGCPLQARDAYPRDEAFYDELTRARATGAIRDDAWLDAWVGAYPDSMYRIPTATYRTSVTYGLQTMAGLRTFPMGGKRHSLFYTNPRGVRLDIPEARTFQDEWHTAEFSKRDWAYLEGFDYEADLQPSFVDFLLFHYDRMIDRGACDALYWDDVFFAMSWNTVGGDAYELPDGSVRPSAGLWGQRELIRRAAVLVQEKGKRPLNLAHMTNGRFIPMYAFAQWQLGWEDYDQRDPYQDYQTRFSRESIRTGEIGRQSGCVPAVFTLQCDVPGDAARSAWLKRTAAAVLLTHELHPLGGAWPEYVDPFTRLIAFGYGTPGVAIANYWDARYPLAITGSPTASLLLVKPGALLAVVCDYGDGGRLTLRFDRARLGIAGPVRARDAETGAPLAVDAAGDPVIELKRHDRALVVLEAPGIRLVDAAPRAVIAATPRVARGTPATLDGSGSRDDGEIRAYRWDFGDGTTSNARAPRHAWADAGAVRVTLTVTDDRGVSATTSAMVVVTEAAGGSTRRAR